MFDRHLIPVIRSPLTQLAKPLCRAGISANQVSLTGFAIGMLALPLLAFGGYQWALAAILLNRLLDGLDGAVARETGITDCGGFLDITLDFIFYAAVVLGFALAAPANALPAATLLFAFMGTGSSFLAFAIMAGKRGDRQSGLPPQVPLLSGRPHRGERDHRPLCADVPVACRLRPACLRLCPALPHHHPDPALERLPHTASPPALNRAALTGELIHRSMNWR